MNWFESTKRPQRIPGRIEPEVMPKRDSLGRNTNKLHWFKLSVLGKLAEKRYTAVFLGPVKNPKFYQNNKNPLDIGIIIKRIDNRYYQNLAEAVTDFRIMLQNYFNFYAPPDQVYRNGINMVKYFVKLMKNRPKGPEVRSTRHPRLANMRAEQRKATKRVAEPCEKWQSLCRAKLSNIQSIANKLEMPFAATLVLEKCADLSKKLYKGHFTTSQQFNDELQRSFHGFHNSVIRHFHGTGHPSFSKKPRPEEPMDSSGSDSSSDNSCDCGSESCCNECCSNDSCNCSSTCPDLTLSSDSGDDCPAGSVKSYISSSSFICQSSSSSYVHSSDSTFHCSSNECSSDSSD
ncbi:uncharacterized protein LOC117583105 [Drosophila guanche]|uniref:Blast:Homeotic protein female sterile n=1 Tax=Drosophila guanche TaxID=7266 RepID=A0A3B0K681_DROGU|nr:uncharacterized protein LOC117583105 [Drosophila guanche]SPP81126.1 blast:Homeotic protein female sterile [Drosophila guanche]